MREKIVSLGAGYSGLLCSYYLKDKYDITILEKQSWITAGQNPSFSVHKYLPKKICKNKRFLCGFFPSSGSIKDYCIKVYGNSLMNVDLRFRERKAIPIWSFDLPKLVANSKIIFNKEIVAGSMVQKKVWTKTGEEFKYDVLISTIPLPFLLKIFHQESSLSFDSVKIGVFREYIDFGIDYNFEIYISSFDVLPYRMYYDCVEKTLVKELSFKTPGVDNIEDFDAVLSPGRIFENSKAKHLAEVFKFYNIFLVGRYAMWDYDFLVEMIPEHLKKMQLI